MAVVKVFEHQTITAGDTLNFYKGKFLTRAKLDEKYIAALWKMYDEKKRPFFVPTRGGIKFCQYVGVVKVLDLTIEILPKADNSKDWANEGEQQKWQSILINMLRICHKLKTPSVSDAALKLKSNSILDLYIERFIREMNYLIHVGLIKKYRKEEINSTALKGKLLIEKNIARNAVHKECFYVSRTSYDKDHLLHQVLLKAIKVLPLICNNQVLLSSCYQLHLNFPEVKDINVYESTFDRLHLDRKSESYRTALEIARLLLLNYRPDVSSGASHSIAVLFDMNALWEEYIYRMLKKASSDKYVVHSQKSTHFWSTVDKSNRYLKPDIIIETAGKKIVIDTKWKNIYNDAKNVSMNDLRQMYAYHHYFDADKCFLLYPGEDKYSEGAFSTRSYMDLTELGEKVCGVVLAKAWKQDNSDGSYLDNGIGKKIFDTISKEV